MDVYGKAKRSAVMRSVKSKDTGAEMTVRRLLYHAGYRYRLHRKDLPGKPDIVFPGRRKIVFVHGCFWHQPKQIGAVWDAGHNGLEGEAPESALDIIWSHLCMINLKSAYWRVQNSSDAPVWKPERASRCFANNGCCAMAGSRRLR